MTNERDYIRKFMSPGYYHSAETPTRNWQHVGRSDIASSFNHIIDGLFYRSLYR